MGKRGGSIRLQKGSGKVSQPSEAAIERQKYLAEMAPLLSKKVELPVDTGNIKVGFTLKGNKHLYSDTFGRAKGFTKADLKDLEKALANSSFVSSSALSKPRKDGITKFYYYKDSSKKLYYNVAERITKRNGILHKTRFLYSVTSKIK